MKKDKKPKKKNKNGENKMAEMIRGYYVDPETGRKVLVEVPAPVMPEPDFSAGTPIPVPDVSVALSDMSAIADEMADAMVEAMVDADTPEKQARAIQNIGRRIGVLIARQMADQLREDEVEDEGETEDIENEPGVEDIVTTRPR